MSLCISHLQNCRVQKLKVGQPKKADLDQVEAVSMRAAACWHLGQELLTTVPVCAAKLKENWYDNFANGEGPVNDELQAVLLDKPASFNVRTDIPTLQRLADELSFSKPVGATPEAELTIVVDRFNLLIKQLNYDVTVWQTWRSKCASLKVAAEAAKYQWRLDRRKRCQEAARHFIKSSMAFSVWEKKKTEMAIADVMNLKRALAARTGAKLEDISYVLWFNASAPCLIPTAVMSQQVGLMSWALSDQMRSVGLMMMPIFHTTVESCASTSAPSSRRFSQQETIIVIGATMLCSRRKRMRVTFDPWCIVASSSLQVLLTCSSDLALRLACFFFLKQHRFSWYAITIIISLIITIIKVK